jgi:hypothetical protein
VVAYSLARHRQRRADRGIVEVLADQFEHLFLALGKVGALARRRIDLARAQVRELFEHVAAEPTGVLHDRLDRGDQLKFELSLLGDILHHPQHALGAAHCDRRGGDEAVEQLAVLGLDSGIEFVDAASSRSSRRRISPLSHNVRFLGVRPTICGSSWPVSSLNAALASWSRWSFNEATTITTGAS